MASTNSDDSITKIASQKSEVRNAPEEAKIDKNETTSPEETKTDDAVKTNAPAENESAAKPADSNTETRKRSAEKSSVGNDEAKRARSDESSNATTTANDSSPSSDSSNNEEFVDKAVELGFKAGDRLEVEWEVKLRGKDVKHEWGATLLPHDGRFHDGFAIRTLDYDPFPAGGYAERSQEDVVFITEHLLLSTDGQQLNFSREGADKVVEFQEDHLNDMLANALSKNSAAWSKLDPAQQAQMGSIIARGKERLLEAITNRWQEKPGVVITSEEIPELLEKAFQGM